MLNLQNKILQQKAAAASASGNQGSSSNEGTPIRISIRDRLLVQGKIFDLVDLALTMRADLGCQWVSRLG